MEESEGILIQTNKQTNKQQSPSNNILETEPAAWGILVSMQNSIAYLSIAKYKAGYLQQQRGEIIVKLKNESSGVYCIDFMN